MIIMSPTVAMTMQNGQRHREEEDLLEQHRRQGGGGQQQQHQRQGCRQKARSSDKLCPFTQKIERVKLICKVYHAHDAYRTWRSTAAAGAAVTQRRPTR